jgi:hypothetical protein
LVAAAAAVATVISAPFNYARNLVRLKKDSRGTVGTSFCARGCQRESSCLCMCVVPSHSLLGVFVFCIRRRWWWHFRSTQRAHRQRPPLGLPFAASPPKPGCTRGRCRFCSSSWRWGGARRAWR